MAFIVDENGNITLVQGDSGSYIIESLPTAKNYSVYFAIQDSNRNPVGGELYVQTNKRDSVTFEITSGLTDLLTVKRGNDSEEYYFGIKLCDNTGLEDTLVLGNSEVGEVNTITVYPKKVEGV